MTDAASILPMRELAALCARWKVAELAVFGSAARGELREDSDLDMLVVFQRDEAWSLLDLVRMKQELETLSGRSVDLIERDAIRNPYRRRAILGEARVLYAA